MKILVLTHTEASHREILVESAPAAEFIYSEAHLHADSPIPDEFKDAEVILGNVSVDVINSLANLKYLHMQSAGFERYTSALAAGQIRPGIMISNATGAFGLGISECMIAMLLALFKNIHLYRDNQHRQEWKYAGPVQSIYGSNAIILGAGDIGTEFAARCKALGASSITGIKRDRASLYKSPFFKGDPADIYDSICTMDELDSLLPDAEIVALSLPSNRHTIKVIDGRRLALMKKDAVIINVGRGTAIDTEALCDALDNNQILGAALDVTDPEPLPPTHRLWKMKNVIITPHVTGRSLKETRDRIIRISASNIKAYTEGRTPSNIVVRT